MMSFQFSEEKKIMVYLFINRHFVCFHTIRRKIIIFLRFFKENLKIHLKYYRNWIKMINNDVYFLSTVKTYEIDKLDKIYRASNFKSKTIYFYTFCQIIPRSPVNKKFLSKNYCFFLLSHCVIIIMFFYIAWQFKHGRVRHENISKFLTVLFKTI